MRYGFIDVTRVGVYEGDAVTVGERRVVDLGVVADDGLEQAGDGVILLEDCGDGIASLGGITGLVVAAG